MLVRDFLQPAHVLGLDATIADATGALTARGAVYIRVDAGWGAIVPHAIVGYPTTRRLIDVPVTRTSPLAAGDDIDVVFDSTQGLDVLLVEDVGEIIGCVDRRHVLDALSSMADPAQLGLLLAARLTPALLHDLGNSLTVADAALQLATRSPDAETLDVGRVALQQAIGLLHRLRNVCSGEDDAAPDRVDIGALLVQLRPLLDTAVGHGIRLDVSIDGDALWGRGYQRTIERCVLNLVLNARDAGPDVSAIRVSASLTDAGAVEIRVDDDGPGVPLERAARIFALGFTTKRGASRGLGLSSVAQALHRIGATIELVPGTIGGASFRILLPGA